MSEYNYHQQAIEDALSTIVEYDDHIAEMARDGEISDDLLNDYGNGDAYHHENHVDRHYSLTEAAELLDQLSHYEETDEGLWQGLAPRDAIAAQAAYTYGNAVMDQFRRLIQDLNENLDSLDEHSNPEVREALVRLWIKLKRYDKDPTGKPADAHILYGMVGDVLRDMWELDFSSLRILLDWLKDHPEQLNQQTINRLESLLVDIESTLAPEVEDMQEEVQE